MIPITFNGVSYDIPEFRDTDYANDLTNFFVAIPNGTLQPGSGTFNLLAELNFGSSFGIQVKQLAVGSALDSSSLLSISSTTKGFLLPRMTTTQRNAISTPTTGLQIFNTDTNQINYYNGVSWSTIQAGGIINPGTQYQLAYYATTGDSLSGLPLITGTRALQSDANGLPTASTTTATELGYLSGVTSAIQTQLNGKASLTSANTFAGTQRINNLVAINAAPATYKLLVKGENANQLKIDNDGSQYTEIDLANNGTLKTSWFWDQINTRSQFTAISGAKFKFSNDTIFETTHFVFGGNDTVGWVGIRFPLTFTSDGASNFVAGLDVDPNITGAPGDTNYQVYLNVAGSGITTQVTDTVNVVAALRIADPLITVGAGGTVTKAASLYIENAPTEGTINAAILVDGGNIVIPSTSRVYFDGGSNTYLSESAADRLSAIVGGSELLRIDFSAALVSILNNTDLAIPTTKRLYLDGGSDTYLVETSSNKIDVVAGTTTTASFQASGVAIRGTNTNDSASTGFVGEYAQSLVSTATSVGTSAQYFDLTSISLTAGDWDVTGIVVYNRNAATYTSSGLELGIGTTAGNSSAGLVVGSNNVVDSRTDNTWSNISLTIPSFRISVASTTTYYLKGFPGSYSAGTPQYRCRMSARRVR